MTVAIPEQAPLMILPGALLFPHALMPLRIFEQRYRAMLNWALVHDRVFCVALMKEGVESANSPEDFHHIAGLGMVRACVTHKDGTSNLMLQGVARVRFTGFTQVAPFFIARIERIRSVGALMTEHMTELTREIRALCKKFKHADPSQSKQVQLFLNKMRDPDMLADSVAHSFVRSPERRQELLSEASTERRLELLAEFMRADLAG